MKIGVIMGGFSSEREVSLKSGKAVIEHLNKEKYEEIIPIIIDHKEEVIEKVRGIDFAFLALHGRFGEDGTIQAVLDTLNIPYSGCGILCSSLCMNKDISKRLFVSLGIKTPKWLIVRNGKDVMEKLEKAQIPGWRSQLIVKPNSGGSSIGAYRIKDMKEITSTVEKVLMEDHEVILEQYIEGQEITSFVLDGKVFPTISIKPQSQSFFDYDSKYKEGGAVEEKAVLKQEVQEKVENISKIIWEHFRCKGYIRIDMIITSNEPYVLEINTLPGLTPESLIPKSAALNGMDFSQLLDQMICASLKM